MELQRRKVLIVTTDENYSDLTLDLGDIPPGIAYSLLKAATEQLWAVMPSAKLKVYGETIFDPYDFQEEEEDLDLE